MKLYKNSSIKNIKYKNNNFSNYYLNKIYNKRKISLSNCNTYQTSNNSYNKYINIITSSDNQKNNNISHLLDYKLNSERNYNNNKNIYEKLFFKKKVCDNISLNKNINIFNYNNTNNKSFNNLSNKSVSQKLLFNNNNNILLNKTNKNNIKNIKIKSIFSKEGREELLYKKIFNQKIKKIKIFDNRLNIDYSENKSILEKKILNRKLKFLKNNSLINNSYNNILTENEINKMNKTIYFIKNIINYSFPIMINEKIKSKIKINSKEKNVISNYMNKNVNLKKIDNKFKNILHIKKLK